MRKNGKLVRDAGKKDRFLVVLVVADSRSHEIQITNEEEEEGLWPRSEVD